MPPNYSSGSSNRTVHETAPLSPRKKFQAHVRTLSDDGSLASRDTPSPRRSPEQLQHVSTLRVKKSESPPPRHPSRPSPIHRFTDSSLSTVRLEPDFVVEEREAWAKPSPLRIRKRPSNDVFLLQPPEEDSPVRQPRKQILKQFGPLADSTDGGERPKTRHGPDLSRSSLTLDNLNDNGEEARTKKNSKFAEGSMNNRSTGVSSTWHEHGSILSGTESDNDSTPRPSPQRSSIDVDEFRPPTVTPGTLKQRLFKIGSAFKHNEKATKAEAEPHTEKKKKGLRKSISMWNIGHKGDKAKNHGTSTSDLAPKAPIPNNAAVPTQNVEVLNERKRRGEEEYAQQFGSKRRKSTGGQAAIADALAAAPPPADIPPLPLPRTSSKTVKGSQRVRRSSVVYINTDSEVSDSHSDIDHHKRPNLRELEKENQQLRAMLKQRQNQSQRPPSNAGLTRTVSTSASVHQLADSEAAQAAPPRKASGTKNNLKTVGKDVPPVPPVPDRVALRTLSNTRNQPKNNINMQKPSTTLVVQPPSDNASDALDVKKRPRAPSAGAAGFLRPVSMILEEDEEAMENRTPTPSPKRRMLEPSSIEKRKVRDQVAVQMKGIRREQWEWPDDVF
ncbi:hypothetical protein LTR10_020600 [Elasticomyces elasticus]|uniref:DUF4045 domain-containing protein n=1 Tax=Exophiala sideris TaxID=1016849 RepID=A0ABR0JPF0_9EURO|nr:hypothetical protein LTR10_020600 [Elasticomyces elasticus]KAK5038371.1 hypothetical protein LTS07_001841 [Exophiala sideris]KAK5044355.1 hypothetical protein LTR13_000711 [Exophiala sideris]KAK5067855.1 hypothetical protein LTR69_001844 [Exophiala sideris]KAK5183903.1 hypothetical protein LTR44_003408 [Eurotiomycetes sp. CCFEE 6388]